MSTMANGLAGTSDGLVAHASPTLDAEGGSADAGPRRGHPPRPTQQLSREQILSATDACLTQLSYDGTTIRKIAGRLDCAVGSIYRYFKDKRDLLAAVTQQRFEPIAEAIERGEPIAQTSQQYTRTAQAEPEQYCLMFWITSVGRNRHGVLPPIIARILDGWTKQIGNRAEAELQWSRVHGSLMLGIAVEGKSAVRAPSAAESAEPVENVIVSTPRQTVIPTGNISGQPGYQSG